MKIQQRRSVFETNSSSVHSITMCKSEDYDAFINGKMYFNYNDEFTKIDDESIKKRKERIKEYIENRCTNQLENFENVINKNDLSEIIENIDFNYENDLHHFLFQFSVGLNYNEWLEFVEDYYETFERSFNGVTAFGYYGHD